MTLKIFFLWGNGHFVIPHPHLTLQWQLQSLIKRSIRSYSVIFEIYVYHLNRTSLIVILYPFYVLYFSKIKIIFLSKISVKIYYCILNRQFYWKYFNCWHQNGLKIDQDVTCSMYYLYILSNNKNIMVMLLVKNVNAKFFKMGSDILV